LSRLSHRCYDFRAGQQERWSRPKKTRKLIRLAQVAACGARTMGG
jgi:hypothetical protein